MATTKAPTSSSSGSTTNGSSQDDSQDQASSRIIAERNTEHTNALLGRTHDGDASDDEEEEERDEEEEEQVASEEEGEQQQMQSEESEQEEGENDVPASDGKAKKNEKRFANLAAMQTHPKRLKRLEKRARNPAPPTSKKGRAQAGGRVADGLAAYAGASSAASASVGGTGAHINRQASVAHPERASQAGVMRSVSGGIGMAASGVSTVASFARLVDNIRNLASEKRRDEMNGFEIADEGMAAAQNGAQSVSGIATTASSAGVFGTTVAQAAEPSEAGGTALMSFFGAGGGIETVSGSAQLLISTARTITGVVRNVRAQRKGEDAAWVAVGTDAIGILKGALSTAQSCVTSIAVFTNIAGKAAELMNAIPLLGPTVNIAIQLLDIAIQVINGIKHLIKLIQARVHQKKLATMAKATENDQDEKTLYEGVADVNRKRFNREFLPVCTAIINTCANLISIGGSVMNICGVATAPAYGAGVGVMAVGYGMTAIGGLTKVGTTIASPVAGMVRKTKQLSNDVRAHEAPNNRTTTFVRRTGIARAIGDADKSTTTKEARCRDDAQRMFTLMKALPAFDASDNTIVGAYERMRSVVKATGVSMNALRRKVDEKAYDEAVGLVVEALKVRGG